jgi:hypothetical protein
MASQLPNNAIFVHPTMQTSPVMTGGHAQNSSYGWRSQSDRDGSHDGHGGTWACSSYAMPTGAMGPDNGYEPSAVNPNAGLGYIPYGYSNNPCTLGVGQHLDAEFRAPESPSSHPLMTDDAGSDSLPGDSSQSSYPVGQGTIPMGPNHDASYSTSYDGINAIPPSNPSQDFQPFKESEDPYSMSIPMRMITEFDGITTAPRQPSSQPWSIRPQQYHHPPAIVLSRPTCGERDYPSPGLLPTQAWTSLVDAFNSSIECSEQNLAREAPLSGGFYPEADPLAALPDRVDGGGSCDLDRMLQGFEDPQSSKNGSFVPWSVQFHVLCK